MYAGQYKYFIFLFCLICVLFVFSSLGRADTTSLISKNNNGDQADVTSWNPGISADGRYVVFYSGTTNLVDDDTNSKLDIFLRDRAVGTTTRVSVNSSNTQGNSDSYWPSISADGLFVVFTSNATNLIDDDSNSTSDVFIHHIASNNIYSVSINSDEEQANGPSFKPAINTNGRYIAFGSSASNLITLDNNNTSDIFVRDRALGETTRVSISSNNDQSNGYSNSPAISSSGRYVAFASDATNLVNNDTNTRRDIFVHDRANGTTTRVSVSSNNEQANNHSNNPAISADGNYVVFESVATNLVYNDTNTLSDIFLHNRATGETTRVSINSNTEQANSRSNFPSISADGRYIAFTSWATNLVQADTNAWGDVFVHDRITGVTDRVSVSSDGGQTNNFSSEHHPAAINGNGRYIAFNSYATNLVDDDTNFDGDIFVYSHNKAPEVSMTQAQDNPITINGYTFLAGYSDDPDNDPLQFTWTVVNKTQGSSYQFYWNDRFYTYFRPLTKGEFTVRFAVTEQLPYLDVEQNSVARLLYLKAGENSRPVANAGPDQVLNITSPTLKKVPPDFDFPPGVTAALDGEAYDPDNDPLRYEWTVESKPSGASANIANSQQLDTTVYLNTAGTYVLKLTATENLNSGPVYSDGNTMTIYVFPQQ